MITSDIPVSGYIPGQTYTITVKLDDSKMGLCGFELTSETHFDKVGVFQNIDGEGTQTLNSGRSVTHTYLSNTPTNGSKTWKVNWVAPEQYTNQVNFYVACNAANGNESSTGDQIYLSSYIVQEGQITGIAEDQDNMFSIYYFSPNKLIKLEGLNASKDQVTVRVLTINGTPVKIASCGRSNSSIDVSGVPAGIYIVTAYANNQYFSQKIFIQ